MEENKEVEKENSVVPESYVREWYYNWFEDMKEIYKGHFKNPAMLSQYNQAYIDGIVQDYDEKDAKEIKKPLQEIATAYEEQALGDFNSGTRQNAIEQDKVSVQQSFDMAINSYKDEEPLKVQTIKTALHTKLLNDNVKAGIISQEFYNKEISRFGKELIVQNLVSVMGAKNISTASKFEIAKRFMEGHTGEESVDYRMAPSERVSAVLQALNANAQMRSMQKERERELKDEQASAFNERYRQSLLYLARSGTTDPQVIRQLQQGLYPLASAEDFDKVANLGSATFPKTTSPFTQMIINRHIQNGTWNTNVLDKMVFSGQISGADAEQRYAELQHPISLNERHITGIVDKLKAETGWRQDGDQRILNTFWAEFRGNDNVRSSVLTEKDALDAAARAYEKAMEKAPLIDEYKTNEMYTKYDNVGLPLESAYQAVADAKVIAQKRLDVENASYDQYEPYLKDELKKWRNFRKKERKLSPVYDEDGRVITNDDLIIGLQLAIIKEDQKRKRDNK